MARIVVRNARVATLDAQDSVLDGVDVVIDGGTIAAVGAAPAPTEGTVEVNGAGKLLVPGFVDTVQNMWQGLFRGRASLTWGQEYYTGFQQPLARSITPQEVYDGVYLTALESLANGVTSVGNYHHASVSAEHIEAGLEAMIAAGVRGRLFYDLGNAESTPSFSEDARRAHLQTLATRLPAEGLITLGAGVTRRLVDENRAAVTEDVMLARELGVPIFYHESSAGQHLTMARWGLLGPDMTVVHGNFATDGDLAALVDAGAGIVATPEAEMTSGRRAMTHISRMLARGGRVALGSDVPGQVQPGLLAQMRATFVMQRVLDGMGERFLGHVEVQRQPGIPSLPIDTVLRMATVNGAASLGYRGAGVIAPGAPADLVLVDAPFGLSENGPATHLSFYASYGDFSTVIVGGEIRKHDGALVGVDVAAAEVAAREARASIYARAGTRPDAAQRTFRAWTDEALSAADSAA